MKKKIAAALAATFALGVTSAFAANPFSDVEARHWAYDSVAKLAKAGIIDGYGDGTFRGDRTMTRYEMAQIVAKAMARSDKANAEQKVIINKLSAEFSSELNNLGVRVGALEKKVGTIKMTGDARVGYAHYQKDSTPQEKDNHFYQRLRLDMNADINENTSFFGRVTVLNDNKMGTAGDGDRLFISDAAFTTKNIFNSEKTSVTVGRFTQAFLATGYWADTPGLVDGIKFDVGNKLKATIGYGSFKAVTNLSAADLAAGEIQLDKAYFANFEYPMTDKITLNALYLKEVNNNIGNRFNVWGVGGSIDLNKDFKLTADYTENKDYFADVATPNIKTKAKAYAARLSYKGAEQEEKGSWGAYIENFRFNKGSFVPEMTGAEINIDVIKGWSVGFNYTLAKNVVMEAMHQFNSKDVVTGDKVKFSRVQVNYLF